MSRLGPLSVRPHPSFQPEPEGTRWVTVVSWEIRSSLETRHPRPGHNTGIVLDMGGPVLGGEDLFSVG